jgi:glycosyltransferase involved in cell wall biosynthesis
VKRVLLVSEAKGFGGAEVYLERLALNLRGWETTLAVPDREVLREWGSRLDRGGASVVRWSSTSSLIRAARTLAPDLVHVNLPSTYDGGAGWLPWRLRASVAKPVITTEHLTLLPRSRRRRWFKLRTAGAIRTVIVVSRASRDALLAEGFPIERVAVVPNGVPDPGVPRALPAPDSALRLGVLGSLEPRKRVELVIEALAICGEGTARLDVAGDGPLRAALEERARALGVAGRVRFLGRASDPAEFLASIDVLALPSRLEGMPLAALEAMAAGRGVLACNIPGMEEVVDDGTTGRLLPADPRAWAEAIDGLRRDPARISAWSIAARKTFMERFTLERCVDATAAVYERALSEEGR